MDTDKSHATIANTKAYHRRGLIRILAITILATIVAMCFVVFVGPMLSRIGKADPAAKFEEEQKAFEEKVVAEVGASLIDPKSADFRKIFVWSPTGAACGEVNAKNVLGGYVGFHSFAYSNGSVAVLEENPKEYARIERACQRAYHLSAIASAEHIIALSKALPSSEENEKSILDAQKTIVDETAKMEAMVRDPLPK